MSERPLATRLTSSRLTASILRLSTLAHCLLKHRCKTLANESHSFPPSQPSFFLNFTDVSLQFSYPPYQLPRIALHCIGKCRGGKMRTERAGCLYVRLTAGMAQLQRAK